MMKKIFFLLIFCLIISGCEIVPRSRFEPIQTTSYAANFTIVNVEKSYVNNLPCLIITVKNTGTATGHGVALSVNALEGTTIVDTVLVFFASGGVIPSGYSARETACFSAVTSHDEYDELVYSISFNQQ